MEHEARVVEVVAGILVVLERRAHVDRDAPHGVDDLLKPGQIDLGGGASLDAIVEAAAAAGGSIETRSNARLREALGTAREELALSADVADVAALRNALGNRGGAWAEALGGTRRVRAAVNQQMAGDETRLSEGDEVAFVPPVTGG